MPRRHKRYVEAVAASPAMIAALLNVRPDDVARAIADGKIKVHQIGLRRRVVVSDAVEWLRSWQEAPPRKPRRSTLAGVSRNDRHTS